MVVHLKRVINGKVQEYIPVCNSSMGTRGQQVMTADPIAVTCKRCLKKLGRV